MATLVLSTVGTALGGPVGSAIGAMIGQSIDQQLLAPVQRGPRVGDLAVQTSTYGTQIPRIYGTMRVAGSVIWSTDLIENEQTDGAKGQPDVSYRYTVSLAVALSSRPVAAIRRIWADGKLLRGEAGDLKVGGKLRLLTGTEQQLIDPLIGSIEGIDSTPAYRGLALAVFEDLELAEYGNRIPFFTFEVEADVARPTCGQIIADATAGVAAAEMEQTVHGYAAYGRSMRSAIEPLVESFCLELFDDGEVLRSTAVGELVAIAEDEFGNSADADAAPKLQREQLPARGLPTSVGLSFYDPARDYQTGEARASASDDATSEARHELPAALEASDAKALAERLLARAWSQRDRLALRLPPKRIDLEPGAVVDLPLSPRSWTVERISIDGFVTIAELRPWASGTVRVFADPGRIVPNPDMIAGPVSLALFDVPALPGVVTDQPVIVLAASQPGSGWRAGSAEIGFGGQSVMTSTTRSKSVLGFALNALGAGSTHIIDAANSVEIALIDSEQWLTNCDDTALTAGANLAMIGDEVLQFGTAESLGNGRFRLSRLLRGRGGTEWACLDHAAGETVCLLRPGTFQTVNLPAWGIGAEINATIATVKATCRFRGESVRPLTPTHLRAEDGADGSLRLSWIRRSRRGIAWLAGVDAPLGEASERYAVSITGPAGSISLSSSVSEVVVDATMLSSVGQGAAAIEVRQIGDFLASRPTQLTINIA